MMKIKYSKKRLMSNLRMGIIFVIIGIVLILLSFVTGEWKSISLNSIGIGQICAGISMLILYCIENKRQYLILKNGELIKNNLIPKKIKLNEIIFIKECAGYLKLIKENGEFIINTEIIAPNSLIDLKVQLKNYNLN